MGYQITYFGAELFAKATDNAKIQFTNIYYGDGFTDDVYNLEDMVSPRLQLPVLNVDYGAAAWIEVSDSVITGTDYPSDPQEGEYFYNTELVALYIYTNETWENLAYDPTGATIGAYKYDAIAGILYVLKKDESVITVKASASNANVQEAFKVREIGLFAKLEGESSDVLFAYKSVNDNAANCVSMPSDGAENFTEIISIAVGAYGKFFILSASNYCTEAQFNELANDYTRHKTSQAEKENAIVNNLGVRAIDDFTLAELVAENDENTDSMIVPTAASQTKPEKGDTVLTLIGKMKGLVNSFLAHISNMENPHKLTAQQLKALSYESGIYTGDGTYGENNKNVLSYQRMPLFIFVQPVNPISGIYEGFICLSNVSTIYTGGISNDVANTESKLNFIWHEKYVEWYGKSARCQNNYKNIQYRSLIVY